MDNDSKWKVTLIALILGTAGCTEQLGPRPRLRVNLQVTGAEQADAMIEELSTRGWPATLWLDSAEVEAECDKVGSRSEDGYEVAGIFPGQILPETTAEEQRTELATLMEVIPRCAGRPMAGFRASRFTSNDETPAVLDEAGVRYLERSARAEFASVYTFKPYRAPGHNYAILPMPVRVHYGDVGSMCDTSSCGDMTSAEFEIYVETAIDFHLRHREPLIIEWHPSLTNPNDPDGWWDAFLGVSDFLEARDENIEFVRAIDLVDRYVPAE